MSEKLLSLVSHRDLTRGSRRPGKYDFVIVGSGCGGGVLANALASRGASVAVVEAGGLMGLTHFANIPRAVHQVDYTHQNIDLYHRLRAGNIESRRAHYPGGNLFGLGGKMMLWGGLSPRMSRREADRWPAGMGDDLLTTYYDLASEVLGVKGRSSPYASEVATTLEAATGVAVAPAGFGFGLHGSTDSWKRFSPVDLFVEDLLVESGRRQNIDLMLLHPAERILHDGGNVTGIEVRSILDDTTFVVEGGRYIVSAGTIASPLLIERSGLARDGITGHGLTDHTVQYLRYLIDDTTHHFDTGQSCKLIGHVHGDEPFNVLHHINTDLGPTADPSSREVYCEVVLLHSLPLNLRNRVFHADDRPNAFSRVVVDLESPVLSPATDAHAQRIARESIEAMGGRPLEAGNFALTQAPVGNAGNDVGSLHLSVDPADGFYDPNLKAHGLANLYGCDASVFPTAPCANPSLTVAALALRLADHLSG